MRELAKAKQEMAALRLQHQRLSSKLQDYSIFNKYLEKVVENSEVRGEGVLPQPHLSFPGGGDLLQKWSPYNEGSWKRPPVRVGDGVV